MQSFTIKLKAAGRQAWRNLVPGETLTTKFRRATWRDTLSLSFWRPIPGLVFRKARSLLSHSVILIAIVGFFVGLLCLNQEAVEGPQRYLKSVEDVDYWITQTNYPTFAYSSSVNGALLSELADAGYQYDTVTFDWGRTIHKHPVIFQSYTPGGFLSPELREGRQVQAVDEAVVDHTLASDLDLEVGDSIKMANYDLRIVGLSRESNSMAKQLVFVNQEMMAQKYGATVGHSVAIRLSPGQEPPSSIAPDDFVVGRSIPEDTLAPYQLLTHDEYIAESKEYNLVTATPLFGVALLVFAICMTVVLLKSIMEGVNRRIMQLAIQRGIGASVRYIGCVEAMSLLITIVVGSMFAVFVAQATIWLAMQLTYGMTPTVSVPLMFVGIAAALCISFFAMILPLWKIKRLEPIAIISGRVS